MNKLSLTNLPVSRADAGTYERLLSVKLNEVLGQFRKVLNRVIDGYLYYPTTITTTYTATVGDGVILCSNGTYTVTLPTAESAFGKRFVIKKISSSGTITVSASAGNIDGSASASISSSYGFLAVISDGTNYWSL